MPGLTKYVSCPGFGGPHDAAFLAACCRKHLPARMLAFSKQFEHHLILRVEEKSAGETEALLEELFGRDSWFLCDAAEAKKAMLHRFVAAGAAVRYHAVHEHEVEDIIALDIALRRNDDKWLEKLPPELEKDIVAKLYDGHFFCHVFHQDYIVRKAYAERLKSVLQRLLDQAGAAYPPSTMSATSMRRSPHFGLLRVAHPTNSFNPGSARPPSKSRSLSPKCVDNRIQCRLCPKRPSLRRHMFGRHSPRQAMPAAGLSQAICEPVSPISRAYSNLTRCHVRRRHCGWC